VRKVYIKLNRELKCLINKLSKELNLKAVTNTIPYYVEYYLLAYNVV
jgi:hypothetical protein